MPGSEAFSLLDEFIPGSAGTDSMTDIAGYSPLRYFALALYRQIKTTLIFIVEAHTHQV